uniref:Endonuclease/exonuclease/phosphatase domain-containing protein n=1 Tax=Stegastes partitus TaxID=144197 RepID=A0A3B4ZW44_9TELE
MWSEFYSESNNVTSELYVFVLIQIQMKFFESFWASVSVHILQNVKTDRKIFIESLGKWCVNAEKYVIIGDFNVCLSKLDKAKENTYKEDSSRTKLFELMNQNNLIDIWRNLNPLKKIYSRKQVVQGELKQSRIDICLTSEKILLHVCGEFRSSSET